MNNNVNKLLVAGLACVALCGTTLAAPGGGHGARNHGRPAVAQRAPAPRHTQHRAPTHGPAHNRPAPVVRHAPPPPRPVVVHHAPPPPPRPVVVHHHECDGGGGLGALIGAVVGGIIGSVL